MEKVEGVWDENSDVEVKWDALKNASCKSAKAVLGYENWRQPDWFRESEADLRPLIAEKNQLYVLWMSTWKERDRNKHARAWRETRKVVRVAKNALFQQKALEAERGRHSGSLCGVVSEQFSEEGKAWFHPW